MGVRDEALNKALQWAQPDPYTVVADDLRDIFRKAGCEQIPSVDDLSRTLGPKGKLDDGCYIGNSVKQWCGIFAVSMLRASGADLRWTLMRGAIVGNDVDKQILNGIGVQRGDVAFVRKGWHHFLVSGVDDKFIYTIEGNAGKQRIMTNKRTSIAGYYKFKFG